MDKHRGYGWHYRKLILTSCIRVWSGACSASDQKSLQRVVRSVKKITRSSLPRIQDVGKKRCLTRAHAIRSDTSHPLMDCFCWWTARKRLRSLRSRTARFHHSFFPLSIRLLNTE